jgi:PAS domain S-box-containing protein
MSNIEYLRTQTVLFVEDEVLAREVLAKILTKLFKKVITAENGREGLEIFNKFKDTEEEIDLIISDINMPIMNGLEMLENIRKIDSKVPAIFVTARNETSNILKAIDLNVTNYVIKPIEADILLKKIFDACEIEYVQKQLAEKQKELGIYLEAVDTVALIFRMTDDGKITFANKSLLKASSYSQEEIENLNFNDLIHPDINKESLDKTWEFIRDGKIWTGNTKFITKNKETFYLKNTIFKVKNNSKNEYITIGFSTTTESIEKREFHKKVLKSVQEFNKKEYSYKKEVSELTNRVNQLESYLPRIHEELEDQKAKTLSKARQLEHYEMQMHNVDEKYSGHMTVKSKEVEDYSRIISNIKLEKIRLQERNKDAEKEIEATKKELRLLTETNNQKNKRINELSDVIRSLESKIRDLTAD